MSVLGKCYLSRGMQSLAEEGGDVDVIAPIRVFTGDLCAILSENQYSCIFILPIGQ